MSSRIDNVNRNRKNIFVGEMSDEELILSLNGEQQRVKVLGRFCIRTESITGNYVVVLVEENNKNDAVIFRWEKDQICVISDKKEWDIVAKTWKSILATVEHNERMN